jgi:hypothetical protein
MPFGVKSKMGRNKLEMWRTNTNRGKFREQGRARYVLAVNMCK